MTIYLLDTNIVSNVVKPKPSPSLLDWLAAVRRTAGDAAGRPRSAMDMIIAAVAEANGCVVVTANEKDFAGIDFINPLRSTV